MIIKKGPYCYTFDHKSIKIQGINLKNVLIKSHRLVDCFTPLINHIKAKAEKKELKGKEELKKLLAALDEGLENLPKTIAYLPDIKKLLNCTDGTLLFTSDGSLTFIGDDAMVTAACHQEFHLRDLYTGLVRLVGLSEGTPVWPAQAPRS